MASIADMALPDSSVVVLWAQPVEGPPQPRQIAAARHSTKWAEHSSNQLRWGGQIPIPLLRTPPDFHRTALITMGGQMAPPTKPRMGALGFTSTPANASMTEIVFFYNADGEMLIVPGPKRGGG